MLNRPCLRSWIPLLLIPVVAAGCGGCSKKSEAVESGGTRIESVRKESGGRGQDAAAGLKTSGSPVAEAKGAAAKAKAKAEGAKDVSGAAEGEAPVTTATLIVTGRVKLKSGEPAEGAQVRAIVYRVENNTAVEDHVATASVRSDGSYRLRVEQEQGNASLKASLEGYVAGVGHAYYNESNAVGRAEVRTVKAEDIVLVPASYVRGRVVDPSGRPVEGAKIFAHTGTQNQMRRSETSSTAEGLFALEEVVDGEVSLGAVADGYVATTQTATAPAADVTLRLGSEGGRVEGNVFDHSTRTTVAGATVTMNLLAAPLPPRTTKTDNAGAFAFDLLPGGRYAISANTEKLRLLPSSDMREGFTVDLAPRETTAGLSLFVYGGHTITGIVRDKTTGKPVAGANVWSGWKGQGSELMKGDETDGEGRFRLTGVFYYPGSIMPLAADKAGYSLVASDPYNKRVNLQLSPDRLEHVKDLELVPTVTVSGTVRTEKGDAVSGVNVVAYNSNNQNEAKAVVTGVDGRYELDAQPYTKMRVKADAKGYPVTFSDLVELDDRSTSMDLTLKAGASVRGRVTDPREAPGADAKVSAYMLVQTESNSWTHAPLGDVIAGPDGTFAYEMMPPVEIHFSATKDGFAKSRTEKVSVSPGEFKSDVVLALRAGFSISGRVTDETSKPLASVHVSLQGQGGADHWDSKQTDADGKYDFKNVPEGTFQVYASWKSKSERREGVKAGSENVDLSFGKSKGATVTGLVVDAATGAPVREFTVSSNSGGVTVEKDSSQTGRFVVRDVLANHGYELTVSGEGYLEQKVSVPVLEPEQTTAEMKVELGTGGILAGRAVEQGTGKPIAGVRVLLKGGGNSWEIERNPPIATQITDEQGRFLFEKIAAGKNRVTLRPEKPLVEKVLNPEVKHGELNDLGDIIFGAGGTIRVKAVRSPGDKPVAKALLNLRPATWDSGIPNREGRTGEDGIYEFVGLQPANYNVSLSDGNVMRRVNVRESEPAEVVFKLGNGTLVGTIVERGAPVGGAHANLTPESGGDSRGVSGDGDGKFTVRDLTPGKWKVSVSKWENNASRSGEGSFEIAGGEEVKQTFTLSSAALQGRVVDVEGQPVKGARVQVKRPSTTGGNEYTNQAVSKADGSWTIASLVAAEYTVTASKMGYGASDPVKASAREDAEPQAVELRLKAKEEGGTLVSSCFQITDGKPIVPAWVKLFKRDGSLLEHASARGADGVMTIEGIPAGVYNMEVSSWGFSIASHPGVEIRVGETVRFDDVLYDAGSFDWTLVDKAGNPVRDVPVRFSPNDPASIETVREGRTNERGVYATRGLAPGIYTARATPPGKKALEISVTIVGHEGSEPQSVVE